MKLEENQRVIACFDGNNRIYTYQPVSLGDSWAIEDLLTRIVSGAASEVGPKVASLFEESDDKSKGDVYRIPKAVMDAMPSSELRFLIKKILTNAIIHSEDKGVPGAAVEDPFECEYFRGKYLEMVSATIAGLDVSFPGHFTKARDFLTDSFGKVLGAITSKAKAGESKATSSGPT